LRAWAALGVITGVLGCGGGSPDPARIRITAPVADAALFGAVQVTATVDGGAAATVRFYVDAADASGLIGEVGDDGSGGFSVPWFSADAGNGAHQLIAIATVDGDTIEDAVAVTVANQTRAGAIPSTAVKQTPQTDAHPPVLEPAFTAMFEDCVPLPGPVNTAGAEDSPYITEDGQELYLFFTPDASVPPNLQLVDGVTGVYRSRRDGSGWGEPERVWLSYHDDPALDGCETVHGDDLWFCTARAGVQREIDIYVAHRDGDHWIDWASAGDRLNLELEVGELHVADGGDSIYYHSQRSGGQGGIDLWVTRLESGAWSDAENLTTVNGPYTDGWPWVSPDGQELWFTSGPAAPELWRSIDGGGGWQAPEKVVSPFAGEATFDADGNLYFTHHFWDDADNSIIEADIYFCQRK